MILRIQLIKDQARILEKHMIKLRHKTSPSRLEQLVEMEMIEELKHLMDDLEEQRKNYKLSDKNRKTRSSKRRIREPSEQPNEY